MIQVLLQQPPVEIIDLLDGFLLDATWPRLVVQHLREDVQLGLGQLGLGGFDSEELGEGEGRDHIGCPLEIPFSHRQILGEEGRVQPAPGEDLPRLNFGTIIDGVVEAHADGDIPQGHIDLQFIEVGLVLMMVIVVALRQQGGDLEIGLQVGVGVVVGDGG